MKERYQSRAYSGGKKRICVVKDLFKKLLTILETEGDAEVDYAKKELRKNILMIEDILKNNTADLDKVFDEIKESYQSIYPSHGGLTEFFVWRDDFEERLNANLPLDNIKKELKEIMSL